MALLGHEAGMNLFWPPTRHRNEREKLREHYYRMMLAAENGRWGLNWWHRNGYAYLYQQLATPGGVRWLKEHMAEPTQDYYDAHPWAQTLREEGRTSRRIYRKGVGHWERVRDHQNGTRRGKVSTHRARTSPGKVESPTPA